ncbi:MAG: hypothetical protein ABFC90_12425 [Bacteroidales bacterium]
MKNIKLIISICILVFAMSCKDDAYVAPDSLSDVAWYLSLPYNATGNYSFAAGKSVSFMDASVNELSHEWTLEDSTMHFLNKGFNTTDTLTKFINPNIGLISKDKTVFVLFTKIGVNKVRLHDTFSESVTYRGTKRLKAVQDVNNPNVWVIDTTFVFNVIEPVVSTP